MTIELPTKKGEPNSNPKIDFNQLVLIGANGSGKTRFGANIEKRYNQITHRVSAQKSLSIPEFVSTKSKEVAENEFLYGAWSKANSNWYKTDGWIHSRWENNINTHLLNDYEKLMVLLHTEEYEDSLDYKENGGTKPNTKLDRVQRIWEIILPHRKLLKKAGVIEAYPSGQEANSYNASQMSDGERVIFYLIAESICAPLDSIVIIDEPEMHIHKSLVKNLFDLIELERPDCSFIYLTHDIDFAFTRQNAVKIWAKSFDNEVWDYEILQDKLPIPEQLYLEVLGSRKPIIFLEGDNSSIDYELYEQVYSDYTVKPLGSCEKVIQTVKSFNEQNTFHHLISYGIIDRDTRPESDILKFNKKNIWILDVAEAENLLLEESIVKAVANHMGKDNNVVFQEVKNNLLNFFKLQLKEQILLHFEEAIRRIYLNLTKFKAKDIDSAISEIDTSFNKIDKQIIYDNIKAEFEAVITASDYDAVLRLFNFKKAIIPQSKICDHTGIKSKEEYLKLVISLLKKNNSISEQIRNGIKSKIITNIST